MDSTFLFSSLVFKKSVGYTMNVVFESLEISPFNDLQFWNRLSFEGRFFVLCGRGDLNPYAHFWTKDFLTTIAFATKVLPKRQVIDLTTGLNRNYVLWSGLYLNHIEILQEQCSSVIPLNYSLSVVSIFQLRYLLYLVSTHCL